MMLQTWTAHLPQKRTLMMLHEVREVNVHGKEKYGGRIEVDEMVQFAECEGV